MAKITNVKITWDNGDTKSVANEKGLSGKEIKRARAALNEHDSDEKDDDKE